MLAEARAYIAELKQPLFGPKADKLTPEQEEQLRQLTGDAQEQAQRPPPLNQEVWEDPAAPQDKEKPRRIRRRSPLTAQLEVQREVLEPADKVCAHCQQERPCLGQEISPEYEYQPAKLVAHETVRPKYGECQCGCGQSGVIIARYPRAWCPRANWDWAWRFISCSAASTTTWPITRWSGFSGATRGHYFPPTDGAVGRADRLSAPGHL